MAESDSIFLPDDEPPRQPKKKRSRWGRAVSWAFIFALAAVVGLDGVGTYCENSSAERLRTFCLAHQNAPFPTVNEVRRNLTGWPLQKAVTVGPRRVLVFYWPSLFRQHLVRAVLDDQDLVVMLDAGFPEQDDFVQPIALPGPGGLVVPGPLADPAAPLPNAPRIPNNRELLAQIDEAFSKPRLILYSGVLLFPVVDGQGQIRPDGAGLSTIASYSTICAPAKRMSIDPRQVRRVLVSADCWRAGTQLDQPLIDMCCASLSTQLYAVPRLEPSAEGLALTVDVQGALCGTPVIRRFCWGSIRR